MQSPGWGAAAFPLQAAGLSCGGKGFLPRWAVRSVASRCEVLAPSGSPPLPVGTELPPGGLACGARGPALPLQGATAGPSPASALLQRSSRAGPRAARPLPASEGRFPAPCSTCVRMSRVGWAAAAGPGCLLAGSGLGFLPPALRKGCDWGLPVGLTQQPQGGGGEVSPQNPRPGRPPTPRLLCDGVCVERSAGLWAGGPAGGWEGILGPRLWAPPADPARPPGHQPASHSGSPVRRLQEALPFRPLHPPQALCFLRASVLGCAWCGPVALGSGHTAGDGGLSLPGLWAAQPSLGQAGSRGQNPEAWPELLGGQ